MPLPNFIMDRERNNEGFDLYFAGAQSGEIEEWISEHVPYRLQCQLTDRKNIARLSADPHCKKLFIDSGAYPAHSRGVELDIDEYIDYVNSIDEYVYCFAQVDKIPGVFRQPKTKEQLLEAPKISWDNYLYMKDKVKSKEKLLPVFHQGEDFKWLENMLNFTDEDGPIKYIGISPANDSSVQGKIQYIDKCFDIISHSPNPNVKTHAFGMTSLHVLEHYPFYSADSTSWILTGAMGNIMTPWGNIDCSDKNQYKVGKMRSLPEDKLTHIYDWFESNNIDKDKIYTDYQERLKCNVLYLVDWMHNYKFKGTQMHKRSLF